MAMPQQQGQFIMPQQQTGQILITTPQRETGQVVMATSQQHSKLNVPVIRGLGITQIVFGVLTIIFGIIPITVVSKYWVNVLSFGIWFGVWITVVGIVGIISSSRPQNNGLNGVNMGFNIVCTVISVINTAFASIGVAYFSSCREYYSYYTPSYYSPSYYSSGYYSPSYYSGSYYKADYYYSYFRNRDCTAKGVGIGIYAFLLLLMIGEFVISLIISIYCCKACCACCKQSTGGQVVYAQQPAASVAYPTTAPHTTYTTTNTGYPQAGYPGTAIPINSGAAVMFQPYTTHGQMVNQQHVMMGAAHTNTVYSAEQQQQPPQYQK